MDGSAAELNVTDLIGREECANVHMRIVRSLFYSFMMRTYVYQSTVSF